MGVHLAPSLEKMTAVRIMRFKSNVLLVDGELSRGFSR